MEKIKPKVVGFKRVYNSGKLGLELPMSFIGDAVNIGPPIITIHANGKPKFRLVYAKQP